MPETAEDAMQTERGDAPSAPAKDRPTAGHRALSALGVVLCLALLPVLAINLTLIFRSLAEPDEVPSVGGAFPMVVLTDSMYPEIRSGDLIVGQTADASELAVGDVISFTDPDGDGAGVVTHRIVAVEEDGEGGTAFRTRGDANDSDDPTPVPADKVIGRYRWRVPGLGHAVMFMQTTPGLALCVVLPAALLVAYDVLRRRLWERRQAREADALLRELEELRARAGGEDA